MSEDMPLLTEQELRTHGVRIYRPHTTTKRPEFDWDALTPACKGCGQRSSQLNRDDLCPGCRPHLPSSEETPKRASRRPRQPAATTKPTPPPARVGKPVDDQAVVEAHRHGESIMSIAARLGVARARIRKIVVDAGEQVTRGRSGYQRKLDEPAIVEAYAGGQSISQICEDLGYSNRRRIHNMIVDAGLTIRPPKPPPPGDHARTGKPVDEAALVDAYRQGATPPQLAEEHGIGAKRVRAILDRHGVERRDDRKLHSGGRPRTYDDEVRAEVVRLYAEEKLSRTQVAEQLGIPYKTVVTIMRNEGVAARERQAGRVDGAAGLKAQIARLDVLPRTIKLWALHAGLIDMIGPGLPSQQVVDAYEAAHGGSEPPPCVNPANNFPPNSTPAPSHVDEDLSMPLLWDGDQG